LNSSVYAGVPYSTGIAAYTWSTVVGNEIKEVQDGISLYAANIISGNTITNVQRYGTNLYSTLGANAGLSKCIISNNIISIAKMGIYVSQGNFIASGNYINYTTSHGIADYTGTTLLSSSVITGNTIRFFGGYGILGSVYDEITNNFITNATAGGDGIYKGKIISGNYIAFCVNGILQTVGTSSITGNTIKTSTTYGIFVSTVDGVTVSGNVIDQTGSDGIHLATVGNSTIGNNVVIDASTANDGIEGSAVRNCTFTGNTIKGFTDGIHISSGNHVILVANIARGCTNGYNNDSGIYTYIYHNIGTIV
jgi:parallel beta-helix repeat protein